MECGQNNQQAQSGTARAGEQVGLEKPLQLFFKAQTPAARGLLPLQRLRGGFVGLAR